MEMINRILRIAQIVLMFFIIFIALGGIYFLLNFIPVTLMGILYWGVIALFYLSLVIGRLTGIGNGIGGILIICGALWNAMASLNGYEVMFMPAWFFKIPLVLAFSGLFVLSIDLYLKREVVISHKVRTKSNFWIVVMNLLVMLGFYFLIHAPRVTLANVDQAVSITYFTGIYLYLSVAAILLTAIALGLVIMNIKRSYKIGASIVSFLVILTFDGIYFATPASFWFGFNPVLLSLYLLTFVASLPVIKNSSKRSLVVENQKESME